MANKKITAEELVRRMQEPDARIEDFAPYFKIDPDEGDAFQMRVTYDPAKVDMGATADAMQRAALALPGFNTLVRVLRRAQFNLKMAGGYAGPVLVAEGDSWFTYPWLDVVGALNDTYAISHLGAAGDTLEQMLKQDEYLDEVRRTNARVLLLSGGGNDALGGGDLKKHLRSFDPALTPAQHVNGSFNGLVNGAIRQFDQIFRRIARDSPNVTAICHGYDYAIPAKGKWLGKPMAALGITDPKFQSDIIREMIDRFTLAMSRLAARYPHVVFLDNRGTVAPGDWADELHPNPVGFKKIARKFDAAIRTATSRSAAPIKPIKRGKANDAAPLAMPVPPRRGIARPTGLNKGISLHIGLNTVDSVHYGGPQTLFGCHFDANAMNQVAESAGYQDRTVLLDKAATVKAVKDAMARAAEELKTGDIFLLTYAGHGSSIPDFNGDEKDDGMDETWCLFDREMLDDEIYELWRGFREGVRVLVISDSCHSGTVVRATPQGMVSLDTAANADVWPRPRTLSADVRRDVIVRNQALYRNVSKSLDPGSGRLGGLSGALKRAVDTPLACTVRLISGCQDNQTSSDGDLNGLFTSRLLQVLESGFSGDYADFHRAILHLMPDNQTPNHWVVGRQDAAFDGQHPFEV
jgi:lysophospholipase L1-like esterase